MFIAGAFQIIRTLCKNRVFAKKYYLSLFFMQMILVCGQANAAATLTISTPTSDGRFTVTWNGLYNFTRFNEGFMALGTTTMVWSPVQDRTQSGSMSVQKTQPGTYVYNFTDCRVVGGATTCYAGAGASVAISIPQPTASASFSPTTINEGGAATLTWSSTNATGCTVTGISGVTGTSGSMVYQAPTVMSNNQTVTIPLNCFNGALNAPTNASVVVQWVNDAPAISAITNLTINEDTNTGVINFTILDEETAPGSLTVTATSSNTGVIPNGNISLGGSGANRTVLVTPLANTSGSSTITINVSDGASTMSTSFVVSVSGVNDAPTISDIANISINENTNSGAKSFTVGDLDTAANSLTVTASSSNASLIPNGNISLGGSGNSRTISVAPAPNKTGSATITVTVSDGALTASDTFTVTVSDLPATFTSIPSSSINGVIPFSWSKAREYVDIRVKEISGNWIPLVSQGAVSGSFTDTRTQSGTYIYQILDCYFSGGPVCTVTDTREVVITLPVPTANASISPSPINEGGSATLTWSSTNATNCSATGISGVSSTSGTATYTAPTSMHANQSITIPVTCIGGGGSATANAALTINWINDLPIISPISARTINEDTNTGLINFTVVDEETAPTLLTVTATSSNTAVIPNANITLGGSGVNRTVLVAPAASASGSSTITISVNDGSVTTSTSFVVTVNGVNDAPTISDIVNISINEKASSGAIAFTVSDVDTAVSSLTITASSSNTGLIPNGNITLGGSGNSRTISVAAFSNKTGSATITVTVSDGVLTVSDTFTVTVNDLAATFTNIPTTSSNGAVPFTWDYAREYVTIKVKPIGGDWTTLVEQGAVSGSFPDTRALNGTYVYLILDCYFAGGPPDGNPTCNTGEGRTVVVTYPAPVITAGFNPNPISESPASGAANTALLSWSATNAQNCSATGISGVNGASGNLTYTAPSVMTTNHTINVVINCTGQGPSSASKSVSLAVNAINDLPTISQINTQNIQEDQAGGTGALTFIVNDEETLPASLTVTAASSNQAVIPDANLALGGTGTNRSIRVTPLPNMFGSSTITLTVSDGQATSTSSFVVNVASVNDKPTLIIPGDQQINKNSSTSVLGVVVGDVDTVATSLTVTAASDRTDIVAASGIVISGSGANRTIKVTPLTGKAGLVTITVYVSDGQPAISKTFKVSVQEPLTSPFDFSSDTPAAFNYPLTSSAIPGLGTNQLVATTQGNLSVNTGAANYSVALELPPAVRDLKPNLSLNYNSRSGNGLMGVGWNLGGLSAITRCRTNFATEGVEAQKSNPRYTKGDRLCLDGQKLVVASTTAAANDATYWAAGTEYKTELDNFAKIVAYGSSANDGHGYFKVWTKDGRILTYGAEEHSQNSKIYAPNQDAGPIKTWALDKVEDAYDNNYTITYERDTVSGEYYPWQINLGSTGLVVFGYQDRTGQMPWGYDAGNKYAFAKVLDKVTTYVGTTTATPIKQYDINYKISATTKRELVDTISECGYESSAWTCARPLTFDWQAGEVGFGSSSPPQTETGGALSYHAFDDANGDGYVDSVGKIGIAAWGTASGKFKLSNYTFDDEINGDERIYFSAMQLLTSRIGKVGIVTKSRWVSGEMQPRTELYSAQFNSATTIVTYKWLASLSTPNASVVTGDFNNDGLGDFLFGDYMWLQSLVSGIPTFTKSTVTGVEINSETETAILDFNNDGLGDLTYVWKGRSTSNMVQRNTMLGHRNQQNKFGAGSGAGMSFDANPLLPAVIPTDPTGKQNPPPGHYRTLGDLNGDGLKDYLYQHISNIPNNDFNQSTDYWYVRFAKGNSAYPYYAEETDTGIRVAELKNILIHPGNSMRINAHYSFTYDYNKDGIEDLILFTSLDPRYGLYPANWRVHYAEYINGELSFVDSGIDPFNGAADHLVGEERPIGYETDNMFRGDVNNDGLMDIIIKGNVYLAKQQQPDLINKITDGFGVATELAYSPLTGDINNGSPLYTPDTVAPIFPKQPVNRAMQVVKKLSISNGQGGLNDTYFNYASGVQDVYRGFGGFKLITITNTATNVNSTTEYRQDWPYTGRVKKQTVKDSGGKLISVTDNVYALHAENTRFPYLHSSLQKGYELSTTNENAPLSVSKTINTFNICGSITEQTTKKGSGFSGADITGEISNQSVVNDYDDNGTTTDCSDDFLEISTQNISKANGADLKTIVTELTPNAQRDIETRTAFKDEAIQSTTTYGYEDNGVVNSITEVAKDFDGTDETARVTTFSNFVYGMYPQTVTNAKGHQTTLTYDYRFGSVKTETMMGLSTTNTFDALGRQYALKTSDKAVTLNTSFYCTNAPVSCPSGAVYGVATQTTHSSQPGKLGSPLSITFYDLLQREVRTVGYSLDGKVINQAKQYQINGYLAQISEPYVTDAIATDTGSATAWTVFSNYDALGRPNTITGADGGSKTTAYSTDTYGLKVTDNIVVIKPSGSSETQSTSRSLNALGQVVKVEDALTNTVTYAYDTLGNLEATQVNNNVGTQISITHDLAGNKTHISDPDAGIIDFAYNGFGELRKQIWQKGVSGVEKSIAWDYDELGRQVSRLDTPASGSTVSHAWVWDTRQQGQLSTRSGNGFTEDYYYDGFARVSRQVLTTAGLSGGEFSYTYDNFSRPATTTYPNGFKIQRDYHAAGYQVQTSDITDSANPKVLWVLGNTLDVRGNFNHQLWGNGVVTQTGFDSNSGRLSSIKSGRLSSNNPFTNLNGDIQNLSYTFDSLGNLYSRTTARTDNNGLTLENTTESFGYDKLNRLTTSTTSGLFGRTQTYQYDTGGLGNLANRSDLLTGSSTNNDIGTLAYDQVRNAGIHAVTSAGGINYSYDKYGNMTARGSESIVYDTFNKPTRIAGASITDFYYGPDHELYKEVSGTKTTYKLAGGVYEVIVDGSTTTQKSYVDGVIMNNRVLISGTQSANDTVYLHTDHLGSVEATTNALGQFVNRMSFSTWGERQKTDWKPGNPTESFLTSSGFTGHDQLDSHNLVHMGGRVYDPSLGRFLSADLYIQSPYDSQSFNRYSYTFNNPLSYTDPTGYISDIITYMMNQSYQHSASWSWSTTASYTLSTRWMGATVQPDGSLTGIIYWTEISTVNSVSAGSIFQTVSYNVPSWGAGPFRVYNFEPGIQQQCGGDAQCAQGMRVDMAEQQLGLMSLAVGGELGVLGKVAWEARAAKVAADKALSTATRSSVNDKLEKYLLNKDHPVGGSKASWFEKALGFNKENKDALAKQIVFNEKLAIPTNLTQHGQKFNQVISIAGANGRTIDVTFGWIRNNDNVVRLVTAIPGK